MDATTSTIAMQPISPQERIATIDILRGFALFGILLVNMNLFGHPAYLVAMELLEWRGLADRVASLLIRFFAEGKFYSTFSFLFGFGFAMQMARAEARGTRFLPLYLRRLSVLLLIGLAHAYLLWVGDILVLYAVLGLLLLLFRRRASRTLLTWVVIMLSIPIVLNAGLLGLTELGRAAPGGEEMLAQVFAGQEASYRAAAEQALRAYGQGSFTEIAAQRVRDNLFMYTVIIFIIPNIFAMFLLGMYAGRRGFFQNIPDHLLLFRRVRTWGLVLGLVGNLIYVWSREVAPISQPTPVGLIGYLAYALGGPALSLFYISAITLLAQNLVWKQRLAPLASVGRMALSNYIFQTLVCTTLFYSYGLGWYGRVGPALGLVLTVAIYAVQVPLSVWWLRRFQFGPLEWLWRSLTYLRWQPLRAYPQAVTVR
jgi:uncharacterized protein